MIVALAHVILSRRVKSTYVLVSILSVIMLDTTENSAKCCAASAAHVNTYEAYS